MVFIQHTDALDVSNAIATAIKLQNKVTTLQYITL
jgi:hypothetical protein